ncbi:SIS domain-containing protein [Phytoactinopolyspora endophytica]|uniref:SIS domain-containing protein n=1 Tax=Phytoactinopolyspora endophytica TaxID=1642495 RepID=UPI00101D89FE|nr:SIS domain-containing protein [Phytoactinopolyspora endophytica]
MPSATHVQAEIDSQPECWRQVVTLLSSAAGALPRAGERVAVIGCGTSWFVAQAYATLRERLGQGETDAFSASEFPVSRPYDRLVAITRSGTTSEVLDVLRSPRTSLPTVAITADASSPVRERADALVVLDFADEKSVVQTRFATTALAFLRAHLGEEIDTASAQAELALAQPVDEILLQCRRFVFLGQGWTAGLAHEGALKMREASLSWAESYPAMEYRHGPISLADSTAVVWFLGGDAPTGLIDEVRQAGAHVVADRLDAMADLVRIQRLAVALGLSKNLDPDQPRHLSRSVILEAGTW